MTSETQKGKSKHAWMFRELLNSCKFLVFFQEKIGRPLSKHMLGQGFSNN